MTSDSPQKIAVDSANGVRLVIHAYSGSGPKVLLIHGIGSSSADFNPVIAGLQEFCQPHLLDLRGHGASAKPDAGYHYSDYVRDLEEVLAHLEFEQPIILGHSLGGIITLMWAAKHPQTARAIIIEDSPLRSGSDFKEAFDGWLTLNALPHEVAMAWYAEKNPHWPEQLVRQRAFDMVNTAREAILELQASSLANEGLDSVEGLSAITARLLFLQGDGGSGSMVHPEDLAQLQQEIPHMGVKQFPGASHTIHRSHPAEWLEAVRSFVENLTTDHL